MTKILAFAGRKSSGKNTAANFVVGTHMQRLKIMESFTIDDKGQLNISDLWGDKAISGVFDIYRMDNLDILNLLEYHIYPHIKPYSFADPLKAMCISIMGLHPDQCYGTDAHKNTWTDYKWGDMPVPATPEGKADEDWMTAREILQYVGSNLFRKMYHDIWADATIRTIVEEQTETALITDCRFPNEVEFVQKAGGKVVYFTRNPFPDDGHMSETALDAENFDQAKFDLVLDNAGMNITQQNEALEIVLKEWGYI